MGLPYVQQLKLLIQEELQSVQDADSNSEREPAGASLRGLLFPATKVFNSEQAPLHGSDQLWDSPAESVLFWEQGLNEHFQFLQEGKCQ